MQIEIIRHKDSEGNDNRGFCHDRLHLRVDGEAAGYLCISYVPFHRLLDWEGPAAAGGALAYAAACRGRTPRAFLASGETLGLDPVVDAARLSRLVSRLPRGGYMPGGVDVTFAVDRPYVDYIRVYEEGEEIRPLAPFRFTPHGAGPRSQQGFLNRRLGLLLYVEGARWLAEQGMLLHGSSNRSPEALRAWNSLARRFPEAVRQVRKRPEHRTGEEDWRIVLDGRLLQDWYPPGVTALTRSEMPSGRLPESNNLCDLDGAIRSHFEQHDRKAREAGREPMGGEAFPCTPRQALKAYEHLRHSREQTSYEATVPGPTPG